MIYLQLFVSFLQIGAFSFGGGYAAMPLIQAQVVELHGWLNMSEFADIITISQMTPGPLAVNTSTFVGLQISGPLGAMAATAGCVLSGIVLSLLLYGFFRRYQQSAYVFEVLKGLKAASLGLIVSAAATILLLAFFGTSTLTPESAPDWAALGVFAASFFVLRKWKVNPILLIAATGILGLLLY